MLIATEQKRLIKMICRKQEQSFLRILENEVNTIIREMREEYEVDVSESDVLEDIAKNLEIWDKVKDNPENFFQLLDESNVGMIKHHLFNSYSRRGESKDVWNNITFKENARRNLQ